MLSPERRRRFALILLVLTLIGWPSTHVALLITHPAGSSDWVFHLLLALSWLALTITALDLLATTDVRAEQDDES